MNCIQANTLVAFAGVKDPAISFIKTENALLFYRYYEPFVSAWVSRTGEEYVMFISDLTGHPVRDPVTVSDRHIELLLPLLVGYINSQP